jgi:hypothetical protein
MNEPARDPCLDTLLELDGQTLFLDGEGRYWVNFEVEQNAKSQLTDRTACGIR